MIYSEESREKICRHARQCARSGEDIEVCENFASEREKQIWREAYTAEKNSQPVTEAA